jgi:hypothetical protein
MKNNVLSLLFILLILVSPCFSQETKPTPPPVVGEVTVTSKAANSNPIYTELRSSSIALSAFSGEYAQVSNLVLKKDRATFTLKSGEIYFLTPVQGRNTGAVFIGDGELTLTPPNETEKKSLILMTDAPEVKEQFSQLVMMFTDKTFDEVKASSNAKMGTSGAQAAKARDLFREKESMLRKGYGDNLTSRTLADILTPERRGFFRVFIEGRALGKLFFLIDPLGIANVYPEQAELVRLSETDGGVLTAFHLQEEYDKGTANSWTDRRTYDIISHNIDTNIQGTRIVVKDVVTIQMRSPNVRFLPFDLYPTLRVKSVRSEDNAELDFIQQKKDEDSDLGVILPAAIEPGKSFNLTFEYDGVDALIKAGSGNFILNPGARSTWYPNNPSSSFGDRAKFDLTFRYPKRLIFVGVGDRVGTELTEGDSTISKWTTGDVELAVAGFNYGDFKMAEVMDDAVGYKLEVYTNKDLPGGMNMGGLNAMSTSAGAKMVLSETQNAMRIYDSYFGKLAYKRVAVTQQPAANFGQAWPTLVYLPFPAFFGSTQRVELFGLDGGTNGFWREVTAHEVAHQWWGHMVGWTSYHDQWMSEGFSQFSASLFIQFVKKDIDEFNDFWEGERKRIVTASAATKNKKPYTIGAVTQGYRLNTPKTGQVAQSLIYPKGGYILHMIRMMMFDHKGGTGDLRFRKMMIDFIASHYNKDVSTEDLKKIVEKHITPEMDITRDGKMDWFFDQWVYGTEVPEFKLSYQMTTGGAKPVFNGKLTQSNVSEGFASVVPLYMDFGQGWKYVGRLTVKGNNTLELNNIALPSVPKKVSIDAYKDILNTNITITANK